MMSEHAYYVYGLYAPGREKGELFYIGKGKGDRLNSHFRKSSKGKNPYKDAVLDKYEGCYVKRIKEGLSESQAFNLEAKLILENQATLTNLTTGGDGASGYKHTQEAKIKMSKAKTGKAQPPELIAKRANSMRGRVVSTETRDKISVSQRGKTLSLEHRAKLSEAHRGKTIAVEIREKMSSSQKGRVHSVEARAKLAESKKGENNPMFGKTFSPETRQRMSKAQKNRRAAEKLNNQSAALTICGG